VSLQGSSHQHYLASKHQYNQIRLTSKGEVETMNCFRDKNLLAKLSFE